VARTYGVTLIPITRRKRQLGAVFGKILSDLCHHHELAILSLLFHDRRVAMNLVRQLAIPLR
jgi:hypothetical protein